MYNRIILIGNLTRDPELRYSAQGTPISNFRLAVSSKFKSSGDSRDETLFIDVVSFGKQAEIVSQYLSKGKSVLVEGRLRERSWEADGQKRSKMEVLAQSVRFLSRKAEGAAEGPAEEFSAPPEETTDIEPF
jgi:single-strand DNA-binding protein